MRNIIEFKSGAKIKQEDTKIVFTVNQNDPVYVKSDIILTGDDITSVECFIEKYDDELLEHYIRIGLSIEGMEQINKAARDQKFPKLILFSNGTPMDIIHGFCILDKPEMYLAMGDDKDWAVTMAELIKSGMPK